MSLPSSRSHYDAPSLSWRCYNVPSSLGDVDNKMFCFLHVDNEMIYSLHVVDELIPHDMNDEMEQSINLSREFNAAFLTFASVCDEAPIECGGNAMFIRLIKNGN